MAPLLVQADATASIGLARIDQLDRLTLLPNSPMWMSCPCRGVAALRPSLSKRDLPSGTAWFAFGASSEPHCRRYEVAARVIVGNDRGIALPQEAMRRLGIEIGSTLLVDVRDGYVVLLPDPPDSSARLRGRHRDVWADVDPDDYVRREREGCRE